MNCADEDVVNYIKIFTTFDQAEVEALINEHQQAPHKRLLQKTLAKDITIRVHSEQDYNNALIASEFLFGNGTIESLETLDVKTIDDVFQDIPAFQIAQEERTDACLLVVEYL